MCLALPLLIILGLLSGQTGADMRPHDPRKFLALKFGDQVADHVLLKLDMHPLQEAFSVCSWIRRLPNSAPYQYWFSYGTSTVQNEILMRDDGVYWILNERADFMASVTDPDEKWRHHCVTWDSSSRKFKVYYEGVLIGTVTHPSSRKLGLGGKIALGNIVAKNGLVTRSDYIFGGEMYRLNVFSKALNGTEVKLMAEDGLCSDVEDQYGLRRYIRWEDVLKERRSGNVTEIDAGCGPRENHVIWDELYNKEYYNKVLTRDLLNALRGTWDHLENFVGSTISEGFIKYFKYEHNKCDDD